VFVGVFATDVSAELVNGDFENGLTGWDVSGDVHWLETPEGNGVAVFGDGLSWIQQEFAIPLGARTLSFLYVMHSAEGQPDTSPFQDTFNALLLDPVTGERLLPPPDEPPLSPAFFSYDREAGPSFDTDFVTLGDPDPDGVRLVTLDVSSLPPAQQALLHFQFLEEDDGYASLVGLDDVVITVPEPSAAFLAVAAVGVHALRRRIAGVFCVRRGWIGRRGSQRGLSILARIGLPRDIRLAALHCHYVVPHDRIPKHTAPVGHAVRNGAHDSSHRLAVRQHYRGGRYPCRSPGVAS